MRKILAVAKAEYLVAIQSKAFLIGVIMTPVMLLGGIVVQALLKDHVDTNDRRCVIVDRSGLLFPFIEQANTWRTENEIHETTADGERKQVRPKFIFSVHPEPADVAQIHADLSPRVESGELLGYAIIDREILTANESAAASGHRLAYHTKTPSDQGLAGWLEYVVNREVQRLRFERAGLDQQLVQQLSRNVKLTSLGLVKAGDAGDAKQNSKLRTFVIPIASMGLLFMMIMMTAPTLLNQVLEEKIQKISEVLISSVSPFQLFMGKLLGTVLVAITLSGVYLTAIYFVTRHFGIDHLIDPELYAWFFFFLILALFMYGSIFSAIGASCNEIKDAQSMMTPAMLIIMIPFFTFSVVLQSPNSALSAGLSLFPPVTPIIMMLRIVLEPGPPLWQLLLGVFLTLGFTIVCVAAAGKVFRIGILSQGQTPTVMRMMKWIVSS
jgi:ABC-2 type transport system permease protein